MLTTRARYATAAVLMFGMVLPARAQESPDAEIFAQQHYDRGVALYRERRLEDALESFRASHALVPSPNSYLYIARSLRGLGRLDEAVDAYEWTVRAARLSEEERYRETAEAAASELDAIAPSVGRVLLRAESLPAQAELTLSGRVVPREALGLPLPVMPGRVTAVLRVPGRPAIERSADVAAGEELPISFDVEPAISSPPLDSGRAARRPAAAPRTAEGESSHGGLIALLVGGSVVGVAGFAVFAAFGLLAADLYSELERTCTAGLCGPARGAEIDLGRDYELGANLGLAAGSTGAALAILFSVLLLAADSHGAEEIAADRGDHAPLRLSF